MRAVHVLGERREHYESMKDVWEMFRLILEQRKRREVDPTLQLLRSCLAELQIGGDQYTRDRMQEMTEFFETGMAAYEEIRQLPPQTLRGLIKVRGKIRKLFSKGAA